jgi:RimJ/RimL family protein N-acetyltransferase
MAIWSPSSAKGRLGFSGGRRAEQQPVQRRGGLNHLPELSDEVVVLRAVRQRDASSLFAHLHKPAVLRYLAACPPSVEQFRRFIRWTQAGRRRGQHACFAIVPHDEGEAVGILQIWPVEHEFATAEWGFVLGEAYWGRGLFSRAARLLLDALFLNGSLLLAGVHRLEARSVRENDRAHRALRNLGAKSEGVLRAGFTKDGAMFDQLMWSILAPEWIARRCPAR